MNLESLDAAGWRSLAGVGVGYGLACTLILIVFFLLPYLILTAL